MDNIETQKSMKSVYIGVVAFIFGLMMFFFVGCIFEYTTVYKDASFELRVALMETSKVAIIPRITYEWRLCTMEEINMTFSECDEDGYIEECIVEYMEEEEYFEIFMSKLSTYQKDKLPKTASLYYFQNNPLLVRASIKTQLNSVFLHLPIYLERTILEN